MSGDPDSVRHPSTSASRNDLAKILSEQTEAGRALAVDPGNHLLKVWASDWIIEEGLYREDVNA